MNILYDLFLAGYQILIRLASLFNDKAKLFVVGRRNWKKNLASMIDSDASYIWVHCASLGEFEQGRPLIEAIGANHPEYRIVLTFFSPSGYEIRKNYDKAAIVTYLPLDSRSNAGEFLDLVKPKMAVFIKYEFWRHYVAGLKHRNIPLYLVSGIFRKEQPFFRNDLFGRWYRGILNDFRWLFVQDQDSLELLQSVGITNCTISGDTRFDRVLSIAKSSQTIPLVDKFAAGARVVVAGSTWKPDEELLARFINDNGDVKFIIAPHEVSETNINRLGQLLKKPYIRFSKADETMISGFQVLIIDSVGMLSSIYKYGQIAYIGGGFGVGIHNTLEAATFGLPVIFGPNYSRFREAREMVSLNAAYPVNDYQSFSKVLSELLSDQQTLRKSSVAAKNYVQEKAGATRIILNYLFPDDRQGDAVS
jgi:3-deoxy-D-manno-octulosonic-acid transferase